MKKVSNHMLSLIFMALIGSCRPTVEDGAGARDAAAGATNLAVSFDAGRYTVRSDRVDVRLTDLRELSLADARHGKVAPGTIKAGQYFTAPGPADSRLRFAFAFGAGGDTVCRSPAAGAAFAGKTPVSCAADAALLKEVADDCNALGTLDQARGTCACPKRKSPALDLAAYKGQAARFRLDCQNAATKVELKAACGELRDRTCKSCKVDETTCQCPTGLAVAYAAFLNDVEGFRAACGGG